MRLEDGGVGIAATGKALPDRVLSNQDLEEMVETSDEWIRTRTGIQERRIAAPGEATSDLAVAAARQALERAQLAPEALDLILVATVTPDTLFPSTACLVQSQLGAPRAAAMDIGAACSGFLYGLAVGGSLISSGLYRNALVIGAETLSRFVDWEDRNTCVLFGDGAGAALLLPCDNGAGIRSVYLGADGKGGSLLSLPAGGSRRPCSIPVLEERLQYIHMQGSEVFKFAVKVMGEAAEAAVTRAGLTRDDVDFLVPHQANLRIIEAAARRLDMPWERVIVNLQYYGNMSSASIPIALEELLSTGEVHPGQNLVLVGFGAGLTWGSSLVTWPAPYQLMKEGGGAAGAN